MQIFLKIFSRLMIFYLAVCGKIIWLFVEISFGDLMFRVPNVNQAEGCLRWESGAYPSIYYLKRF